MIKPTRTLSAEGIAVRFDGLLAISSVSLSVRTGEILGLIGPNGAGKTTLVNCLTGFQAISEGKILLDVCNTAGWGAALCRRAGISRTFQAGRLFKEMSVAENVEAAGLGLGLRRHEARHEAARMLDWLGLADHAHDPAGSLPYTDERRVGIARALIGSPSFVLLDEPAAGMSDGECEGLMNIVLAMPKLFGCGVLLIEHNMRVVMNVCDRIHVLDGGRTLAEGSPTEVATNSSVIAAYLGGDV